MESAPEDTRHQSHQQQSGLQTTQKADAFQILGRLADRMLVMGRADAAVRILNGHMQELLVAARSGDFVSPEVVIGSTNYAMKIAVSGQDGAWVDYVLELHLQLQSLLAPDVVKQIDLLVRKGVCIDRELFARYRDMIRSSQAGIDLTASRHILEFEFPER